VSKRTTLTLDDDVAAALQRVARQTARSHRDVVNDAIRRGLREPLPAVPFVLPARPMRRRPSVSIDDIEGLMDALDGPSRR
jgi:hypothetical protein